jgi:transcriptional regulator with XRE-family HTH domain
MLRYTGILNTKRAADRQKSLRQLAKAIGILASYLSQVRPGKRKPSHKVLSKKQETKSGSGGI